MGSDWKVPKYETVELPYVIIGNRRGYRKEDLLRLGCIHLVKNWNLEYDLVREVYLEALQPQQKD